MKLFFASTNLHKIEEVEKILEIELDHYEKGNEPYIEENGTSFFENALIKAKSSYKHLNRPVLCEDSGIVVPALKGEPGVHSARYAGEKSSDSDNRKKLLLEMQSTQERKAYYISTFVYLDKENEKEKIIEASAVLWGTLSFEEKGLGGFGYDCLFIPDGYTKTLAELGDKIKNQISHRRKAIILLKNKLRLF